MIAAQAYQESGLDQSKRRPTGAIGVMQVLPRTAADPNVNIADIEKLENNIHAGVKYLLSPGRFCLPAPPCRLTEGTEKILPVGKKTVDSDLKV